MSKAAMCIRMLQILNSGRVYKVSELANLLETNPRNVIEYKKELEEAGYYIISIPGKYGGYQLDKTTIIPSLKFTEEEKKAISEGAGYLEARNDFLLKKDFQTAMSKVYSSMRYNNCEVLPTVIDRFPLAMNEEEIASRYKVIYDCIQIKHKIEISYRSNDNLVRNRIVHPYKQYMYNNSWFFIGFCELTGEFRYFKLNRILSWTVLPKTFRRLLSYNESALLDRFGMVANGEWHKVKLKFSGKFAMVVQDYRYGKNQVTECVSSNETILALEMQYRDTIVGFVLSFGAFCEVIEPEWLKDEVKNVATEVSRLYN